MRRFALLVLVLVPLTQGCKGKCRQLSEQLCDCSLNSSEKTACLQRVSTADTAAQSVGLPTAADEARCDALLTAKACDCRLVDTDQGKVNCGLAR